MNMIGLRSRVPVVLVIGLAIVLLPGPAESQEPTPALVSDSLRLLVASAEQHRGHGEVQVVGSDEAPQGKTGGAGLHVQLRDAAGAFAGAVEDRGTGHRRMVSIFETDPTTGTRLLSLYPFTLDETGSYAPGEAPVLRRAGATSTIDSGGGPTNGSIGLLTGPLGGVRCEVTVWPPHAWSEYWVTGFAEIHDCTGTAELSLATALLEEVDGVGTVGVLPGEDSEPDRYWGNRTDPKLAIKSESATGTQMASQARADCSGYDPSSQNHWSFLAVATVRTPLAVESLPVVQGAMTPCNTHPETRVRFVVDLTEATVDDLLGLVG